MLMCNPFTWELCSYHIFYLSRMRRQAERWGAELFQEDVETIDVKNSPFIVQTSERKVIYSLAASSFTSLHKLCMSLVL